MKVFLIAIIVIVAILIILFVAVKASQSAARRVEQTEEKAKNDTLFMRGMTAKAELLMKSAENEQARQAAKEVYEAFRFSDPISTEKSSEIESDIESAFNGFSDSLKSDSIDTINERKMRLIALIEQRKAVMKTLK